MVESTDGISFDDFLIEIDQDDKVHDPHKTSRTFQHHRDIAKRAENEKQAEVAQLELEAFSFVLKEGHASHQWGFTLKDGTPDRFPDIKRYTDADLKYFEDRFDRSKNPYLRLRYAQLLWSSSRKNLAFAKSAVDSSIEILTSQLEHLEKQSELPHDQTFVPIAKNAFYLSKHIKYRHEEVCKQIHAAAHDTSQSSASERLQYRLLSFMVEESKSFGADSFVALDERCLTWATNSLNPHEAIDFLKLGETISRKVAKHSSKWQIAIGQQFEVLLNGAEERSDLTMPDFCLSAIEAYKLGATRRK